MSEAKKVTSAASSGIGFRGLLTVLFIALKLTGYIGWSWWWILAPLWAPYAVAVVVLGGISVGVLIVGGAGMAFDYFDNRKRRAKLGQPPGSRPPAPPRPK